MSVVIAPEVLKIRNDATELNFSLEDGLENYAAMGTEEEYRAIGLRVFALWLRTEAKNRPVKTPSPTTSEPCLDNQDLFFPETDLRELEDEHLEALEARKASNGEIEDFKNNEAWKRAVLAALVPTLHAKKLCGTCPIAQSCLDASVLRGEEYGVWGGWNAGARAKMRGFFLELTKEYRKTSTTDARRVEMEQMAAAADSLTSVRG